MSDTATRRPKLLLISTQMEAAGVQVLATGILRAQRAKGVEASLLFLYKKRDAFEEINGIKCLLPFRPTRARHYAAIILRLFREVRLQRPTTIVGFAHFASPLAAVAGALARVPQRIATQTNPPSNVKTIARVLDWLCGCVGLYTANIAASNFVRAAYGTYPPSYRRKLLTVHNGIEFASSALTRSAARQSFGLDEDVKLILTCGRLAAQKNHSFLLDVVRGLKGTSLVIAGDGELREKIEQKIRTLQLGGRVHLLGEIPPARVADLLRCGDVFAFPSTHEAFGLAAVEAMAEGLPVVTSNHPALSEVIGDAGILLPIDDPAPWQAAIDLLFSDRQHYAARSSACRARSRLFSFDAMMAGFESHLR